MKSFSHMNILSNFVDPGLRTGDQPLIPGNVEDQIILWDRERTRVKLQEVYSLQCQDEHEYESVKHYATEHGSFEWGSEAQKRIIVKYEVAEATVAFVRRLRTRLAGRG